MAVTKILGKEKRMFGDKLCTSVHFSGASVNSGAAVVNLLAAVTDKMFFIEELEATNVHATEVAHVEYVEDESGTPVIRRTVAVPPDGITGAGGTLKTTFSPPLPVTAGKTFGWRHQAAEGDTYVSGSGWQED